VAEVGGFHVRHGSDGEFSLYTGWDDGLCAGGGKGAFDSVEGKGWVTPASLLAHSCEVEIPVHESILHIGEEGGGASDCVVQFFH
jgi:hypothetical protein